MSLPDSPFARSHQPAKVNSKAAVGALLLGATSIGFIAVIIPTFLVDAATFDRWDKSLSSGMFGTLVSMLLMIWLWVTPYVFPIIAFASGGGAVVQGAFSIFEIFRNNAQSKGVMIAILGLVSGGIGLLAAILLGFILVGKIIA